jgi:acyl phosphate:glycerol-3-phosphate acyltransferase
MRQAMTEHVIPALMALLVSYLCGSIPFGLILTRLAGLGDIREIGSGNIGATNVLRTGSKKLSAATLAFDALKATIPVYAFAHGLPMASEQLGIIASIGAFLGHLYPVWLKFKGGKGVATYIGLLLGFQAYLAAVFCIFWLSIALLFRKSSLAALVASLTIPIVPFLRGDWLIGLCFLSLTALLWWRHVENIKRLIHGEEQSIGSKG